MTIDEAIAQEREKAKEIRENIIDGDNLEQYESYCNTMVAKSAEKYEQIAEWLEELKELREYFNSTEIGKYRFQKGYNKAIDDFVEELKRKTPMENCLIDKIAEQLKEGGENEYGSREVCRLSD